MSFRYNQPTQWVEKKNRLLNGSGPALPPPPYLKHTHTKHMHAPATTHSHQHIHMQKHVHTLTLYLCLRTIHKDRKWKYIRKNKNPVMLQLHHTFRGLSLPLLVNN